MRTEEHKYVIKTLGELMIKMEADFERREHIREDILSQAHALKQMVEGLPSDYPGIDWMHNNLKTQDKLLKNMLEVSTANRKYIDKCYESMEKITYSIDLNAQGVLVDEELHDVLQMEAEVIKAYHDEMEAIVDGTMD